MPARPWIDGFSSGYMQRVMHRFPKQGNREPWINPQNYSRDKKMIRFGTLDDGALIFSNRPSEAKAAVASIAEIRPAPRLAVRPEQQKTAEL
jgi:hypothetical protein